MELSEPLYQKLKINKLKDNIILNDCIFIFDKLTNNVLNVFDQFFQPHQEEHNQYTRRSQQYLLNIPKTNTQMFGSNSIKIKSITDWNEIIRKIHFSSELLFKHAKFIKLVKSTFHDRWLQNKTTLWHTLYETTIKQYYYNFLMWFIEWDS